MQKLYCYVDETGQDAFSEFFVVVAIVSGKNQDTLRKTLLEIEFSARTGHRKWHKSRLDRRLKYLELSLEKQICRGEVYFGRYKKPLPYFFPILETIAKAILRSAPAEYRATVIVDGIDRKKAAELTNALRLRKVRLELVRSRRDEAEPVIRLADMWAGCIRAAYHGEATAKTLLERAIKSGYLVGLTEK